MIALAFQQRRLLRICCSALLLTGAHNAGAQALKPEALKPVAPQAAQPISAAETLLFQTNQWHQVHQPVALRYAYKKVSSVEPGFDDEVRVDVTKIHPDGSAAVALHFLTGARNVKVADLDHAQANPALLGFLERDIAEMKRLTGGATNYFRKRIRLALADGAQMRPVKFTYQGRQLDGQEVSVQPYLNDPLHERFKQYVAKRYVFILSQQVAGGVYQIRSSASAGAAGAPMLIEETLTLTKEDTGKG